MTSRLDDWLLRRSSKPQRVGRTKCVIRNLNEGHIRLGHSALKKIAYFATVEKSIFRGVAKKNDGKGRVIWACAELFEAVCGVRGPPDAISVQLFRLEGFEKAGQTKSSTEARETLADSYANQIQYTQ